MRYGFFYLLCKVCCQVRQSCTFSHKLFYLQRIYRINVTGFMKTNHTVTRTEMQITYALVLMIHSCTVHGHQLLGYRQSGLLSQMAFCRLPVGTLQDQRAHWGALIRIGCVPNCCQQLSRPILQFLYILVVCWEHSTTVCSLMAGFSRLWLATHPHHPTPPHPTPTRL